MKAEALAAMAIVLTIVISIVALYELSRPAPSEQGSPYQPPSTHGIFPTAYARIETSRGNIVVELYGNETPITVNNFEGLAKRDFYNGTIFNSVTNNYAIQGGGLLPNLTYKDRTLIPIKLETNPSLRNLRGMMAMARKNASDTATSQFFINLKDNPTLDAASRPPGYAVFGKVIQGMDVVDTIGGVPTSTQNGYKNVPTETIMIYHVVIMSSPGG